MGEFNIAAQSFPIWKAILWCFYPVSALVAIEYFFHAKAMLPTPDTMYAVTNVVNNKCCIMLLDKLLLGTLLHHPHHHRHHQN